MLVQNGNTMSFTYILERKEQYRESHIQNLFVHVMHDARETKLNMMSSEKCKAANTK